MQFSSDDKCGRVQNQGFERQKYKYLGCSHRVEFLLHVELIDQLSRYNLRSLISRVANSTSYKRTYSPELSVSVIERRWQEPERMNTD